MSEKSSIYEARAAFSVTASSVGSVRGVMPPPLKKAPQPAHSSSERYIGVIVIGVIKPRYLQCGLVCYP